MGYPEGIAWSQHERGLLGLRTGEADAEERLSDALARHRELGDRWRVASVLEDLAAAALPRGAATRAATLLGVAAAVREQIGTELAPCEQADHDDAWGRVVELLGAEALASAWGRGHGGSIDEALSTDVLPSTGAAPTGASVPVPVAPARSSATTSSGTRGTGLRLRIGVLGAATVEYGGRVLTTADWGYGKPRELLFLLASCATLSKEEIGRALWPDLPDRRYRNSFHTALRDLRRALGDPRWVAFEAGRYRLDPAEQLVCDLRTFEAGVVAARRNADPGSALPHLQRALAAYGGDLLPGLDDEWVVARRRQLRTAYGTALSAAGRLLMSTRRFREAADVFHRAAEHDPLDEGAHRALMTALLQAGEPGQAVRVYRELAARLRDELGVAPAAETTAIHHRLTARGDGGRRV